MTLKNKSGIMMNKVFVLTHVDREGFNIVGVFDTLEKAMKAREAACAEHDEKDSRSSSECYRISDRRVL